MWQYARWKTENYYTVGYFSNRPRIVFIIYYSSDSPSSVITESSSGHPVTVIFIFTIVLPWNVIFGSVQSIAYATLLERSDHNIQYYSISLPCRQGAVEGKVRIRTANFFFFRLRNRQKLVRIRFENVGTSLYYFVASRKSEYAWRA